MTVHRTLPSREGEKPHPGPPLKGGRKKGGRKETAKERDGQRGMKKRGMKKRGTHDCAPLWDPPDAAETF